MRTLLFEGTHSEKCLNDVCMICTDALNIISSGNDRIPPTFGFVHLSISLNLIAISLLTVELFGFIMLHSRSVFPFIVTKSVSTPK